MPTPRPASVSCAILSALILSTFCFAAAPDRITGPIVATQGVRLATGVPMQARPEFDQGRVDPSMQMNHLRVLTAPSAAQQRAINKLLADQQNPRSASYHKWLTPEQYADRFGLGLNDVKKISAWLESRGFTVTETARGRNWIVFSGTAAQVEAAFQTEIHTFKENEETHFANITPPSIPSALAGIVSGFRGLNNFRAKSQALRAAPDYTFPVTGGAFHFIAPGDIATMYDLGPLYAAGIDGTGQTLAVIGQTDIYLADLADFRSGFGLSAINCTTNAKNVITACNTSNFQYKYIDTIADPGVPNTIGDDLVEADIDIQWSGATARNAQIIYVNAPDPAGSGIYDSMYYTIDNKVAPVMTMSYTFPCELAESQSGVFAADEAEFQKANSEGITFMNSSGDTGAAECDFGNTTAVFGYAVAYPASSPSITGVGGTLIPYTEYTATFWGTTNGTDGGSALSYIPEDVWNDAQEWSIFCTANPTQTTCKNNPGLSSWQSAQETAFVGLVAGGGGPSNCVVIDANGVCQSGIPQPSYQAGLNLSAVNPTGAGQTTSPVRFSPDVSLLASIYWPGYIVCTAADELPGFTGTSSTCSPGGTQGIVNNLTTYGFSFGGTSISSPVFAGIVTLLNQYLQGATNSGLGNINPTLYALAATPSNGAFHQLNTGSVGAWCTPGTPTGVSGDPWPTALVCPSTGPNAAFIGFDASHVDPTTGYNLAIGLGSVDANNLALAWAAARPATTVTVQASPTQNIQGLPTTLTATVSGSSPTGSVSFFNNGSNTALGTATVSGGVATLSTTALPAGTDNITASYAGDGYNAPSTTVTAFVVTVVAPSFTLATNPPTSHIVLAGQSSLTYQFVATPTTSGQSTFTFTVTFACSFAPTDPTLTNASCAFTPPSIPAGAGPTNVTATITTAGPNTGTGGQFRHRADNRMPWLPLSLPLAGIVVAGIAGRKLSKYSVVASLCLALALLGVLMACGGSSAPPISVSGVSGSPASLFPNNTGWPSQTAKFSATISNDGTNKGVTWAVTGSPTNGTIDATGLYTAPTVAAGLPARVTITATSVADSSKSASTTETLNPATVPGAYTATVTASEANATPQTAQVSLTVQ